MSKLFNWRELKCEANLNPSENVEKAKKQTEYDRVEQQTSQFLNRRFVPKDKVPEKPKPKVNHLNLQNHFALTNAYYSYVSSTKSKNE